MLDEANLKKAMDIILTITKEKIIPNLGKDDDILPALFLLNDACLTINVIGFNLPSSHAEKTFIENELKRMIASEGAAGYAIQFMGWALEITLGTEPPKLPLRTNPDKKEVLLMAAGSKYAAISYMFAVTRVDGKITELTQLHKTDDQIESIGLFQDMLNSKPSSSTKH